MNTINRLLSIGNSRSYAFRPVYSFLFIAIFFMNGCAGPATLLSCVIDDPAESVPINPNSAFAVELEYSVNGKYMVITDTMECRYKGRACDGRGVHNQWERTFASGRRALVLKELTDNDMIFYPLDGCKALMGGRGQQPIPAAALLSQTDNGSHWTLLNQEELKGYGIQIHHFMLRQNIENSD